MVASSCPAGFRSWVAEIGAFARQQLGDAVDGVGRDPLDDVAEIGFGLDAWNKLVAQPWTVMSIGLRDWAHGF